MGLQRHILVVATKIQRHILVVATHLDSQPNTIKPSPAGAGVNGTAATKQVEQLAAAALMKQGIKSHYVHARVHKRTTIAPLDDYTNTFAHTVAAQLT